MTTGGPAGPPVVLHRAVRATLPVPALQFRIRYEALVAQESDELAESLFYRLDPVTELLSYLSSHPSNRGPSIQPQPRVRADIVKPNAGRRHHVSQPAAETPRTSHLRALRHERHQAAPVLLP